MENKVDLSELHGTVIASNDDQGYSDDEIPSDEINDDVFYEEEQQCLVLPSIPENGVESAAGQRTRRFISRGRKATSRSSGYESDIKASVSDPDKRKMTHYVYKTSTRYDEEVAGGRKTVSLQTDFSSDEERPLSAELLNPPDVLSNENLECTVGEFCWRHDNVYDTLLFPPARPSSFSSIDEDVDRKSSAKDNPIPQKLNLTQKSCQKCKVEEFKKIHLSSRRESIKLKKDYARPSVAEIKHCSVNILASRIDRCSNLWTENRTFYLGTQAIASNKKDKRQRSMSFPFQKSDEFELKENSEADKWVCCHCDQQAATGVNHRPCLRHLFWVRQVSLYREGTVVRSSRESTSRRRKRDWILVQCVTKIILKAPTEIDSNVKFSYRECGEQEMILCPEELRSIDYIEDICCQHFIKMPRNEAIQNKRVVELLYSPKGPMLREDKHLEGKSIFYFCCDPTIKFAKTKRSPSIPNAEMPPLPPFPSSPSKATEISDKKDSFSDKKEKKRKSGRKKSSRLSDEDSKSAESTDNAMKKSVTFADEVQHDDDGEEKLQSDANEQESDALKRRASLPPPPPNFLGGSEEDIIRRRRKRRESVAISFGDASGTNKTEKPKDTTNIRQTPVKTYERHQWKNIKVAVSFKGRNYSTDFLEYKTLEDLYAWVKEQLLKDDVFTPGTNLLLSHKNVKFPLKANTASSTIANLLQTEFACEEIKQNQQGGAFGDNNSRFDTRFTLPLDLRKLESVSPGEYLSKYCIVSDTWRAFYQRIFVQSDRDTDGQMTYSGLKEAMEKLFVELAHPLLKRVLFLLGYDPNSKAKDRHSDHFGRNDSEHDMLARLLEDSDKEIQWQEQLSIGKDTFVSICALANRIICRETKIDGFYVDAVKQSDTQLEDADFYNIDGKIKECSLDPLTQRLLLYVKK